MIDTITDVQITDELLSNYFKSLVNAFFKILPLRENEEKSLPTYMKSLQLELLGSEELISQLDNDPGFLELVAILQFFIDNPDLAVSEVKREVFKCIHICERLESQYAKAV